MKKNPIPFLLSLLLGVGLLTGCRSSKVTTVRGGGSPSYGMDDVRVSGRGDYSSEEMDGMGRDLVAEARRWLGTPYRYGGQDRSGTDCSGLVLELYRTVCAMKIPRTTSDQKSYCVRVDRDKARAGDLMFFGSGKNSSSASHVGLYIGKGEMIHASSSRGVTVSNVDTGYWGARFQSAGRVAGASLAWAKAGGREPNVSNSGTNAAGGDVRLASASGVRPVAAGEIAFDALRTDSVANEVSTASIDLLDSIINEKVDSIFSRQFME